MNPLYNLTSCGRLSHTQESTTALNECQRGGVEMSDEVQDVYGINEIFADGLTDVHLTAGVMRITLWAWRRVPGSCDLQKVCVGKLAITRTGMIDSVPRVAAALAGANPCVMDDIAVEQGATSH